MIGMNLKIARAGLDDFSALWELHQQFRNEMAELQSEMKGRNLLEGVRFGGEQTGPTKVQRDLPPRSNRSASAITILKVSRENEIPEERIAGISTRLTEAVRR